MGTVRYYGAAEVGSGEYGAQLQLIAAELARDILAVDLTGALGFTGSHVIHRSPSGLFALERRRGWWFGLIHSPSSPSDSATPLGTPYSGMAVSQWRSSIRIVGRHMTFSRDLNALRRLHNLCLMRRGKPVAMVLTSSPIRRVPHSVFQLQTLTHLVVVGLPHLAMVDREIRNLTEPLLSG